MNETAKSTGSEKSTPPRDEKPMSLQEALEFLRSALHFVAIAGVEPEIEYTPQGLRVEIPGALFREDMSGDIYLVARATVSPQISSIATTGA